MQISERLQDNIDYMKANLPIGTSFDLMTRDLYLGETKAYFMGVNGFCKTEILQRIFSDLQDPSYMADGHVDDISHYVSAKIGYAQTSLTDSWENIFRNVLSGPSVLFIDGFAQAVLIDVRTYPTRGIAEPDLERVTRGSRDGFVETLVVNANLIRRRVRSTKLTDRKSVV